MGGCIAFFIWGFGGAFALFCCWALILRLAPWTFTGRDVAYATIVAAMLFARWLSASRYAASVDSGRRSTPADFRRYALLLPVVATIGWIVAQSLEIGGFGAGS